jgi:type II secretory pathway predicted ATPase ExeA/cell division protein FtsN
MSSWFDHFHLSADPFSEDSHAWSFYYGGRFGIASLKLEQALEQNRGLIVVTGPPGSGKSSLVRSAVGRMRVFASATVSAAQTGPATVIDVLLRSREPLEGGFSSTRKRAALIAMIEQARASGRAIVCIIDDAHHARPGQIKDLMAAIETAPNAASVFQVILVGRPPLLDSVYSRALGELRARTTTAIETSVLSANEITDFLTERLEAVEAPVPDVLLPPVTMAAIAHHSRGLIGLASVLARSALERAADNGISTVSVEMVDEIAALYGNAAEAGETRSKHPTARAFALGAVAALVVLALVVAAAEVKLLGTGGRRVRADVDALSSLAGFGQVMRSQTASADMSHSEIRMSELSETATPVVKEPTPMSSRDAQLKSPREEFLGESKPADAAPPRPYSVDIKPPQRPAGASAPSSDVQAPKGDKTLVPPSRPASGSWAETHVEGPTSSGETVVTVPGIPGPLVPGKTAPPILRKSTREPAPVSTPPATDTAAARNLDPPVELGPGPHVALQVGAFRERASAEALKAKLSRDFEDAYVSAVDSGGEPLFRVRVGKFRSPEDAAPLRERLQAAGYASFRVNEP